MVEVEDNWTRLQTLLLIQELKKYPCLYDPSDSNYCNKKFRETKYIEILNECQHLKPLANVKSIKNKVKTLHSQLWKEIRNKINFKKHLPDEIYVPKLWCFKEIKFLLPFKQAKLNPSNINLQQSIIELEELQNSETSTSTKPENLKSLDALEYSTQHIETQPSEYSSKYIETQPSEYSSKCIETQPSTQLSGREEELCRYLCFLLRKIKSEDNFDNLSLEIIQLVNTKINEEKQQQRSNQFFTIEKEQMPSSCNDSSVKSNSSSPFQLSNGSSFKAHSSRRIIRQLSPSHSKHKSTNFQKSSPSHINVSSPFSDTSLLHCEDSNISTCKPHFIKTKSSQSVMELTKTSDPLYIPNHSEQMETDDTSGRTKFLQIEPQLIRKPYILKNVILKHRNTEPKTDLLQLAVTDVFDNRIDA